MKLARVCGHELWVSDLMAEWDAIAEDSPWEKERIDSVLNTLKYGDVLFDIGVEHAWQSAIYAKQVGGANMVLVEPSPEFWPTIRKTWDCNEFVRPLACFEGYAGRHTDRQARADQRWPASSVGEECREMWPYRHLSHHRDIPQIKIDKLTTTVAAPKGITIDVEGAELEVLEGAHWTMANIRPHLWISLHPDLLLRDFGAHANELFRLLLDYDYAVEILRVDHETHVHASPK